MSIVELNLLGYDPFMLVELVPVQCISTVSVSKQIRRYASRHVRVFSSRDEFFLV